MDTLLRILIVVVIFSLVSAVSYRVFSRDEWVVERRVYDENYSYFNEEGKVEFRAYIDHDGPDTFENMSFERRMGWKCDEVVMEEVGNYLKAVTGSSNFSFSKRGTNNTIYVEAFSESFKDELDDVIRGSVVCKVHFRDRSYPARRKIKPALVEISLD